MELFLMIASSVFTGFGIVIAREAYHHYKRQKMMQDIHDTVDGICKLCDEITK